MKTRASLPIPSSICFVLHWKRKSPRSALSEPRVTRPNNATHDFAPRLPAPQYDLPLRSLLCPRLQVVHAEPYFSREDDVPERPREFAGKVFRILHRDDLQVCGMSDWVRPLS